ncbi:MAG: hypothetical protein DHS20C18_26670 [Saprospiraceae bacterium]|nr:MAG: hypothetical protein DHS20C18_26670 [Saprospiraceae bacterium]
MTINKQHIQRWIGQIQHDQIGPCIEEICQELNDLNPDQRETVINLSARFNNVRKDDNKGTISLEEKTLEMNKIRVSLLSVMMDIQDQLIAEQQHIRTIRLAQNETEFREMLEEALPPEKYTDLKCISNGDYCLVYSALRNRNSHFREKVAIKVFKNLSLIDEENVQELADRFAKSRQYSHVDGIITILDDGLIHPPRFYVMPYVDGMRLSDRLKLDWPLQLREIKKVLLKITEALIQGHQDELLHLNLRPSNIMIDREGEPQIFPFQVIRFNVSQRSIGRIKQIVAYWSPEQFNGEELTEKTDQYALGLVAFELFRHLPFFRGDTVLEVLNKRITFENNPDMLEEELSETFCPKPMIKAIRRMLSYHPADRFADLDEVWDEIDNLIVSSKPTSKKDDQRKLKRSFDRCRKQEHFYRFFYDHFFSKSPQSKAIFEKHFQAKATEYKQTEEALWDYQHRMLDLAIDRLLAFYGDPHSLKNRLSRLAQNHTAMGIPPAEFHTFLACLKETIAQKDTESWKGHEEALENIWREMVDVVMAGVGGG